jgi:hypothetical protein
VPGTLAEANRKALGVPKVFPTQIPRHSECPKFSHAIRTGTRSAQNLAAANPKALGVPKFLPRKTAGIDSLGSLTLETQLLLPLAGC